MPTGGCCRIVVPDMNFSQRKGLGFVRQSLQNDEMSAELRTSLWNVLHRVILSVPGFRRASRHQRGHIVQLAAELWEHYFKLPVEAIPYDPEEILNAIKSMFFEAKWNEIYDFIEAVVKITGTPRGLVGDINVVLERELSGYRLMDGVFVDVTSEVELAALETAFQDDQFSGVTAHLKQALAHLSNREAPDYRNSIKESISAVEGMVQIVSDDSKATLGDSLKKLKKAGKLHGALSSGFSKLYG